MMTAPISIDTYLNNLARLAEDNILESITRRQGKLANNLVQEILGFTADVWGNVKSTSLALEDQVMSRLSPDLLPRVHAVLAGEVEKLVGKLETQPESDLRRGLRKRAEERFQRKFDEMVEAAIDKELSRMREQVEEMVSARMRETMAIFEVAKQVRNAK